MKKTMMVSFERKVQSLQWADLKSDQRENHPVYESPHENAPTLLRILEAAAPKNHSVPEMQQPRDSDLAASDLLLLSNDGG